MEKKKTEESSDRARRRFSTKKTQIPPKAGGGGGAPPPAPPLQPLSAATRIIRKVIAQMETEDGWVSLGPVGSQLGNMASDFDPRTFGFKKLSDLVKKTNAFDVDHVEGRPLRIRLKQHPKPVQVKAANGSA